jgi:hypothetical protein
MTRLIVHDREMYLEADPARCRRRLGGSSSQRPREGDRIGTATVTGFEANGSATLDVRWFEPLSD